MKEIEKKNRLVRLGSYLSVFTAAVIIVTKFFGWLITDSAAMFASFVDSALDITSSIINVLAIRFALIPADDNHRFGHQKIQDLAVFGQAIFFMSSSIFIIFSAIANLQDHTIIKYSEAGIYSMIFSIIFTLCLVSAQQYIINETNSDIIKADRLHYITDLFSNLIVIVSLYFSTKYWFLDGVLAIIVAIYLFCGAYKILKVALKNLLDEEFSQEDKVKISEVITKYKRIGKIISIHDLKTRKAGSKHFIQFHLVMDGTYNLIESHKISDEIENEIASLFSDTEIIIHQDPAEIEEKVSFKDE